jgi:6-pyruvoyltetrahydropterin/6-carboxytetrahydropterin synthase
MADTAFLTKRVSFSAMHALGSDTLSEEKNREIFGKCFRTHGHDYFLEVTVRGAIDADSGLCCDRDFLEDILHREIVDRFHKTHLNDTFGNTTGENLAREFFDLLRKKLKPLHLVSVRVQETPRNFFSYGEDAFSKDPLKLF